MGKKSELKLPDPKPRAGVTSIEEALQLKKPVTESALFCLDGSLADPVVEANAALVAARESATRRIIAKASVDGDQDGLVERLTDAAISEDPDVVDAQKILDDAEAEKLALSIDFLFQALGGQALEDLMERHPPTAKQAKEYREQLRAQSLSVNSERLPYNPDTFPPVLIAESCVSPQMTIEQARELWNSDNWNKGERSTLLDTAMSVNMIVK